MEKILAKDEEMKHSDTDSDINISANYSYERFETKPTYYSKAVGEPNKFRNLIKVLFFIFAFD